MPAHGKELPCGCVRVPCGWHSSASKVQPCLCALQDSEHDPTALGANRNAVAAQGGGFIDTILNLIPGRKQQASTEPTEDSIKKTHDYLR